MRRTKNRLDTGRQVRVERRDDRAVLVQPGGGAVQLNETAAAILELCDGSRTLDEVIAAVLARPDSLAVDGDVRDFIDAALQRGWVIET